LGMVPGDAVPLSLEAEIRPRDAEWALIRAKHNLVSPDLKTFVGLSYQYADYQMGFGRTQPSPPSFSSTIKLMQAGFHEVMDTDVMFVKWLRAFQEKRLLPPRRCRRRPEQTLVSLSSTRTRLSVCLPP